LEDALLVDVTSGEAKGRLLPGLRPAWGFPGASSAALGAGSSVHYFVVGESVAHAERRQHRVVRIDFATGERKVVAGPGAAVGERLSAR
jgi:hypothetical protein